MSSQFPFALSDQCVRCGLCLPHCPTYQAARREGEGPRGRIVLMDAIAASRVEHSAAAQEQLEHCLGCGRCESVCPAGVPYLEIRDAFRADGLTWLQGLRLRLLSDPGSLIWRRWGLRFLRWLPDWLTRSIQGLQLAARIAKDPATQPQDTAPTTLRQEHAPTLTLFQGCLAPELDARAQGAALRVLQALPVQSVAVGERSCCGAMAQHGGQPALAKRHAQRLRHHRQPLVALDSGCLAKLRESLDEVHEACRLVLQHWPNHWQPRLDDERVYLHIPCTHFSAGDTDAVPTLLRRIQGLTLIPLRGRGCCGAGGTHLLDDPEHAAQFAQALLLECDAGPGTLVSTNIGCRVHLRLNTQPMLGIEVRHPLEILERALQTAHP